MAERENHAENARRILRQVEQGAYDRSRTAAEEADWLMSLQAAQVEATLAVADRLDAVVGVLENGIAVSDAGRL